MRKVSADLDERCGLRVRRVVDFEGFAAQWEPSLYFLVRVQSPEERRSIEGLQRAGLDNLAWTVSDQLEIGDIVVARPSKGELIVLLRATDIHHALFLTNRCNSNCLMCSQPPTKEDDGWLVEEALEAIRHLNWHPRAVGLTGGEPLLLGTGLRRILDAIDCHLPQTAVEVLTNGRLFADASVVEKVLSGLRTKVRWLVPLYGHANFMHDFVVQAPGAFDETIDGLLTLQEHQQEIQLRSVLISPVLEVLPEMALFVARNLPFIREWALMGCEPIGFALANRDACEVDLVAWAPTLEQTRAVLRTYRIPHVWMNTPLCALPQSLWPQAQKSISDWKNVFAPECEGCAAKGNCSGLFAWHERGWKPAPLRTLETIEVNL
ncbi:His-Xaa-Ser system radical SAM maturase HxsC [Comamonas sp. 17RB]|uniref:His-Xaa-Ser system radical SAM maturase HxsC n=1 Tax=Comamonas sp. 17RB TaxID=3047025 RepID=UPI0024B848C6|nr:His-Xaa-Ser system radical SAM maturase HxsC [Comamonas sp. 17RB]MDI9853892.1 His-Xaa-Ser system radical SAM maturase HxsC [Comamonas sp. 17RB]